MKNYIQPGDSLTVTLGADILSGAGLLVGTLFAVACKDGLSGEEIEVSTRGVFELPKTSANTPAAGAKAYWNDTTKEVTTTASGNSLIGVFTKAYAGGTTVAHVRLDGVAI